MSCASSGHDRQKEMRSDAQKTPNMVEEHNPLISYTATTPASGFTFSTTTDLLLYQWGVIGCHYTQNFPPMQGVSA
jgi:hypothetical protein